MFNADHIFVAGSTHTVCQDYARSAVVPEGMPGGSRGCIALADGCSSSPDTDIGARLLVLETLGRAASAGTDAGILCAEGWRARVLLSRILRGQVPRIISPRCLDATLLVAVADEEKIRVAIWGDGVLIVRRRENRGWMVQEVSFVSRKGELSGYPLYPSYFLEGNGTACSDSLSPMDLVLGESPLRRISSWNRSDSDAECPIRNPARIRDVEETRSIPAFVWEGSAREHDLVVLMSDGVSSFYRQTAGGTWRKNEPLEIGEVLDELLDFRGLRGKFVQRRVKRVLGDYRKQGVSHSDDFSMAALHIGEERREKEDVR